MNSYSFRFPRVALAAGLAAIFSSATATTFPEPPRQFTATAVSSTEVQFTWTTGQHDYAYWIRRTGPDGKTFSVGQTTFHTFADRALEPDTTYTYTLVATKGAGYEDDMLSTTVHTPGWQGQDIGAVGAAGSVQRTGDVITVTGSGADIWDNADAFQFVSQPWNGDGVLIVRVDRLDNTAQWAKAGIMFRESLAPGARHVLACVNPKGDGAIISRGTTDGPGTFNISIYTYLPQWLKLVRKGSSFQAFQSRDGIEWTLIGSATVDMPANIYAGLAVTSHSAGTPCTAVFDGFNLSPTWEGNDGAAKDLALTASSDLIKATWTNATTSFVYTSFVELSRDVAFRTSLAATNPGRTDASIQVEPNTTYYVRVRPSLQDGLGLSSPILSITTPSRPPGITPAAPTALTASVVSSDQVNLMWADNADIETGYIIERSADGQSFESIWQARANTTSYAVMNLAPDTKYYFRVAAVRAAEDTGYLTIKSGYSSVVPATTLLTPAGSPVITRQPSQYLASVGSFATLSAVGDGSPTYQWLRNDVTIPGATTLNYVVNAAQPQDAGVYTAAITNGGGTVMSQPGIIGVTTTAKVAGAAHVVASDIQHPNGNVYDQVLLDGASASITADPGQVTRISYVDLNDDIVQVEFSGAGTLSLSLDDASGPAPAAKYNQPGVAYMKGHATLVIAGGDETTNVAIFSVGRANAVNPGLFRDGVDYDGVADLALLAVATDSGRLGGVFAGDAHFFGTRGLTGIFAPNIGFAGPVVVNDVSAFDGATPVLRLGQAATVSIAGGSLAQANNRRVQVDMVGRVSFVAGTKSNGQSLPAQANQGRLERNGTDVTAEVTGTAAP